MRPFVLFTAVALALAPLVGLAAAGGTELAGSDPPTGKAPAAKPVEKAKAESGCGNHGTSIEFLATPSEAARQAKKEQKLVFVLHVSGHFEDPKYT